MQTLTDHEIVSRQSSPAAAASGRRGRIRRALGLAAILWGATLSSQLFAQVPTIVVSSQANLTPANNAGAGPAVVDSCGNTYVNLADGGGVIEIAASNGAVTVVTPNTNGYNNGTGLAIDPSKSNLYFPTNPQWYSSVFSKVPLNNCVPGTPQNVAGNFNTIGNYYYGTASTIAVDTAGDLFFTPTCCSTGEILEESAANVPSTVLASFANSITALVVDASGNLYFTDGNNYVPNGYADPNIYELAAPYTGSPTAIAAVGMNADGLVFDPQGNLYISDIGSGVVYVIPSESGALNPADMYQVLSGASIARTVGLDASDNIYYGNYAGALIKATFGAVTLPATAYGSTSAPASLNYVFNSSFTPASISVNSGTAASTTFAAASGCMVGTTYTAGQTCSIPLTYTPSAIGLQTGAVIVTDGNANTSTAGVSGVGQGPAVTIDPGVITAETPPAPFVAPEGVAVDSQGNVWVVDAGSNSLTEFLAGSTTGTAISTGSLTLSAPTGVAVDGAGNVYIADTGNNRVVELADVQGVLAANAVALNLTLSSPEGVAVDGSGNLYIADTGDKQLVFVPMNGNGLNVADAQDYPATFAAPSAVTVDASGNVYVADSGNNNVLEFTAPLGSEAAIKAVTGLNKPTGLATDASGSLFVVDSGSFTVYRYAESGGVLGSKTVVGGSILNPYGVAADASGNLYISDNVNALLDRVARVQAALQFGAWNVGTQATPLTANVSDAGNMNLTLPSPSYTVSGNTGAGFTITNDGCGQAGTVMPGASCSITAGFKPPVTELNAEEDLTLLSNTAVGAPTIALIGTGADITPSTLSLVLTSPPAGTPLTVVTPVTFTATVNTGSNTAVPGGSVQFLVNGNPVGTVAVTNAMAVLSLPNGLPGGPAVVITANYSGDQINYSGSSASLTLSVAKLQSTLSLTLETPYNNPYSANDNASNPQGPSIPLVATLNFSGAIIPGGTVSFYSGTPANPTLLGTAPVVTNNGAFQATFDETSLRAGTTNVVENNSFLSTYSIFAVYSGDTSLLGATSPSQTVNIVAPPLVQPVPCTTTNPATCGPNTTGAAFSISVSNPTVTVAAPLTGQGTGSTIVTITSYGGWSGILNFTCSGLPAYTTCNPFPGYPTVNASTPSATLTPTQVQFFIHTDVPPLKTSATLWWIGAPFGLFLLLMRRRLKVYGLSGVCAVLGLAFLLTASVGGLSGCGNSIAPQYVTPAGNSTITVKVSAAQLVPGTTAGATELPDVNTGSFQLTLQVQ